jgi:hypothetical protein
MKRTLHFISHFSQKTMFLIILVATNTVPILSLGLNQNQIAIAQQQGLQNDDLTSSSPSSSSLSLTNPQQQQHNATTGICFEIGDATFSHHMATVNNGTIQMHYVIGGHGDPLVLLHGWPET